MKQGGGSGAGGVMEGIRGAAQEPTLRSPMWKQLQLEQAPAEGPPPLEPQRDGHSVQAVAVAPQSPRPPPAKHPAAGNSPREAGRYCSRRPGKRRLRGKKAQIEHMKRRLRYVFANLRYSPFTHFKCFYHAVFLESYGHVVQY